MPSSIARGSKLSHNSCRGRRLMYLKSGPRNCFFKLSHKSFRWGELSGKSFRGGKFVYLKSDSVEVSLFVFTSAHLFPHRGATLGGYSLGLPISDLGEHLLDFTKRYRGPFNDTLFREKSHSPSKQFHSSQK